MKTKKKIYSKIMKIKSEIDTILELEKLSNDTLNSLIKSSNYLDNVLEELEEGVR